MLSRTPLANNDRILESHITSRCYIFAVVQLHLGREETGRQVQEEVRAPESQVVAVRALQVALVQAAVLAPQAAANQNLGQCAIEKRQGNHTAAAQNSIHHLAAEQAPALTVLSERTHQGPGSQRMCLRTRCSCGGVGVADRALVHRRDLRDGGGDCSAGLRADGLGLREGSCTRDNQAFRSGTASDAECWSTLPSLQRPLSRLWQLP